MSGTQSPPLEATGSHKVLGSSSVTGSQHVEVVPDAQQREQYFKEPGAAPLGSDAAKQAPKEKTD